MAVQETRTLPAPFIDKLGTDLATQITAQAQIPVVAPGAAGISQLAGESPEDFAKRQQAAQQFDIRQQSLAGLAPQVAGLSGLEQQARTAAQAGIGSFAPFVQTSQLQAGAAQGILGQAGSTLGGVPLGAQAFQQDVSQFMSPFQSQVIDATLSEFDRNQAIREQGIRDQQAALGALGSGRAGVQLAEFGTGAARERALLQANLLQQGFQQAQGARQQDIANRFGLGQAQAGLAGQQLGQAQFQTGLASLVPGLQRADVGQLGALGAIDRSLDQARLDAQRQATQQAAFLPQQQLDRFAGQVTGLMGGYPGGTRQEFIPQPTPLQSALGIATTLGGLYLGSR
tara:strand:+ start:3085 stop:4110 length:1026 start_codon:yes stop_codon:yes gene_type:complete